MTAPFGDLRSRTWTFDWDAVFDGVDWFHVSGITPALSQSAADLCFEALGSAKAHGATVSCDYNYRAKLWKYGKQAPEVMRELVRLVDVGIAKEGDCQRSPGITLEGEPARDDAVPDTLNIDHYRRLCARVLEEFPNLRCQAITLRMSHSASHNEWSACLCNRGEFLIGPRYNLAHITDRVGAGDSFAAGLIYGLLTGSSDQQALDFAVAASALKHTIPGDFNLVTLGEVQRLETGGLGGMIQR